MKGYNHIITICKRTSLINVGGRIPEEGKKIKFSIFVLQGKHESQGRVLSNHYTITSNVVEAAML